jgi:hypothetical protein
LRSQKYVFCSRSEFYDAVYSLSEGDGVKQGAIISSIFSVYFDALLNALRKSRVYRMFLGKWFVGALACAYDAVQPVLIIG